MRKDSQIGPRLAEHSLLSAATAMNLRKDFPYPPIRKKRVAAHKRQGSNFHIPSNLGWNQCNLELATEVARKRVAGELHTHCCHPCWMAVCNRVVDTHTVLQCLLPGAMKCKHW